MFATVAVGVALATATSQPSPSATESFYADLNTGTVTSNKYVEPSCDMTEVLLAARALEPFLRGSDELMFNDAVYRTPAQGLREAAARMEREDAAIARLRRALAACAPRPSVPHDDGDQKNPVQAKPETNQQPKEKP